MWKKKEKNSKTYREGPWKPKEIWCSHKPRNAWDYWKQKEELSSFSDRNRALSIPSFQPMELLETRVLLFQFMNCGNLWQTAQKTNIGLLRIISKGLYFPCSTILVDYILEEKSSDKNFFIFISIFCYYQSITLKVKGNNIVSLLTVCDSSQSLVESRSVTVISEGHIHTPRQQPAREGKSIFV